LDLNLSYRNFSPKEKKKKKTLKENNGREKKRNEAGCDGNVSRMTFREVFLHCRAPVLLLPK
jgi:hypothetical protein